MEPAEEYYIKEQLQKQRDYFTTGATRDIYKRLEVLRRLKSTIIARSGNIESALWKDLHKSAGEAYVTETGIVLHDLDLLIRKLKKWSRTGKVGTPFFLWPSRSRIIKEPYGHVLIIGPWNYPFQLIMAPLVAAVAAGNVVTLKLPHDAPHTAQVIQDITGEVFEKGHVNCFVGEAGLNGFMLEQRFDYIFFTGSPRVGKIVMAAAANFLTPVTLELGGKSPCIVDKTADLKVAAKRIIFGKLVNAGQTCIAPDYLLVHKEVKKNLLEELVCFIRKFYGDNAEESHDYPRIISPETVDRLMGLLREEEVYYGGSGNRDLCYMSPTILDNVSPDSPVMQEEIFGPVLPVLTVNDMDEAVRYINAHEKPLALYYFGSKKTGKSILRTTSSGGACINDTLLHIANPELPFGGVGQSGMGSYHGRAGFNTFTHRRSVLISKERIDFSIKYPPYKNTGLLKKLM